MRNRSIHNNLALNLSVINKEMPVIYQNDEAYTALLRGEYRCGLSVTPGGYEIKYVGKADHADTTVFGIYRAHSGEKHYYKLSNSVSNSDENKMYLDLMEGDILTTTNVVHLKKVKYPLI